MALDKKTRQRLEKQMTSSRKPSKLIRALMEALDEKDADMKKLAHKYDVACRERDEWHTMYTAQVVELGDTQIQLARVHAELGHERN